MSFISLCLYISSHRNIPILHITKKHPNIVIFEYIWGILGYITMTTNLNFVMTKNKSNKKKHPNIAYHKETSQHCISQRNIPILHITKKHPNIVIFEYIWGILGYITMTTNLNFVMTKNKSNKKKHPNIETSQYCISQRNIPTLHITKKHPNIVIFEYIWGILGYITMTSGAT